MALFIFKYALPALLGYTLFIGIAGKFNPLHKPDILEERPSWMLGLWTGLSVFIVLSIGLHMAYGMSVEAARLLAAPGTISVALLLGIGFVGYYQYRRKVLAGILAAQSISAKNNDSGIDWSQKVHQLDSVIGKHTPSLPQFAEPSAIGRLSQELEVEKEQRLEAEHHLRIVRKALAKLHQMKPSTAEEYDILLARQENHEITTTKLKRDLVNAKQEIRMHVAARAKALSTANKSVAFARQNIDLRARLETELETAHSALSQKHMTIASLIKRLERERRLTDDELKALSSHFAVNDPTIQSAASSKANKGWDIQHNAQFSSGS